MNITSPQYSNNDEKAGARKALDHLSDLLQCHGDLATTGSLSREGIRECLEVAFEPTKNLEARAKEETR